jgi:hypothetical protein
LTLCRSGIYLYLSGGNPRERYDNHLFSFSFPFAAGRRNMP